MCDYYLLMFVVCVQIMLIHQCLDGISWQF